MHLLCILHKHYVCVWFNKIFNILLRWPRDEYVCAIVIELWEMHDRVMLEHLHPLSTYEMEIVSNIMCILQAEIFH